MKKIYLLFCFLQVITTVSAQSLLISSTESRCQNTGTITVLISGGTPTFSYQIYDGPLGANAQTYPVTQVSSSTTHTFNDLIPGKYYIRVIDQNTTILDSAIVGGSYSIPLFTLDGVDVSCPSGNDGKIFIESNSGGREPFTYQIISPFTSGIQNTDTFFNLALGTYQVRMYDSCGNYQTRSYTLTTDYQPFSWALLERGTRLSCDSFELKFRGWSGIAPYTFYVINPNNLSDTLASQIAYNTNDTVTFNLPIYLSGPPTYTEYIIVGVDACGESVDDTRRFDSWYYPNNDIGCDSTDVYFGGPHFNKAYADSIRIVLDPDPLGLDTFTISTEGSDETYMRLPNGVYRFDIISGCDAPYYQWFGYVPPTLDSVTIRSLSSTCEIGKLSLNIEVPSNVSGRYPSGPYTYLIHKDGVPIDTIENHYNWYYSNDLDSGFYEVWAWNACGDTAYNSVHATNLLTLSTSASTIPGCGLGDGSIYASASTNDAFPILYSLYSLDWSITYGNTQDSGKFFNLDTGAYRIRYSHGGSYCTLLEDTLYIGEYQQPQVIVSQVSCTNGSYAIQALPSYGAAPYTYYLRDPNNGFSIIRGPVSTDTFTNLGAGVYNVLVEDACGNTVNANSSPYVPNIVLTSANGTLCAFQNINLRADTVLQSTYSWTGPNGFTSSNRVIPFAPIYHSDSGLYKLDASVLGGCVLLEDSINLIIDSITPAFIQSVTETCTVDSVYINLLANEYMITETGEWTVLSAPSGAVYRFDSDSSDSTLFVTNTPGTYQFEYTITGANGCEMSDRASIVADCPYNIITGTVFIDKDEDGIFDNGEGQTPNVKVYLYSDVDNDGIIDIEDRTPIDSAITDINGFYSFVAWYNKPTESYFVAIDSTTLPTGSYLTTDNEEYAQFTSGGNTDPNNDFGHSLCDMNAGIASVDTGCLGEDVVFAVSPAVSGANYAWSFENGSPATSTSATQLVNWSSTGTFAINLIASDATCDDTITKNIVINAAVTASAAPNDTVCRGGQVELDGTASTAAGVNYNWSVISGDPFSIDANANSATPTVSPHVNTRYLLTVAAADGICTSTAFVDVNVNVNLNPTASLSGPSGPLADSSIIFLDGTASSPPVSNPSASLNYSWLEDGFVMGTWNYDTMTTEVSGTTNYAVICIDAVTGCADTAFVTVTPTLPPVPVEFIGVSTNIVDTKDVLVKWSTASELNNERFEVQRKYEHQTEFTTIGEVKGSGTTNEIKKYSFVDTKNQWLSPICYYRIKQVDYDGSVDYSYDVPVSKQSELEVLIYPNPAQNETTVATLGEERVEKIVIRDVHGREITNDVNTSEESSIYTLNLYSLRNGTYYLEVSTKTQRTVQKIMVAR